MSIQAFQDAIAYFNYAGPKQGGPDKRPGDYGAVKDFLSPHSCRIQKVNDPDPLQGTPDQIVDGPNGLNATQKGIWPILRYVPGSLEDKDNCVTGQGYYIDGDPNVESVVVRFKYHFDNHDRIEKVEIETFPGQSPPPGLVTGQNPYPQ